MQTESRQRECEVSLLHVWREGGEPTGGGGGEGGKRIRKANRKK